MPTQLHYPINHDAEPIRLFQSDLLEFFTHIHPAVVVAIWLPVVLVFLGLGIVGAGASPLVVPAGFLVGVFVWTLAEYTLHRFVFHYRPRSPRQERIVFLFHGVHHAQPDCKTRLVMPPVVSIPLALVFYMLFRGVVGSLLGAAAWVDPLIAGFAAGYLAYDLTHYATHHSVMRGRALKFLKRHHMLHHYKTPDARFGVSSHLWDIVFRTLPVE
jgi:sterol desaturase/sphingolipid hydroxylase (fatty acid hydroxylase superfamily)